LQRFHLVFRRFNEVSIFTLWSCENCVAVSCLSSCIQWYVWWKHTKRPA
jgi:hypothetical protein